MASGIDWLNFAAGFITCFCLLVLAYCVTHRKPNEAEESDPTDLEPYTGPIEPGMRFQWEPLKPYASSIVTVDAVTDTHIYYDQVLWCSVERFREACCPVGSTPKRAR